MLHLHLSEIAKIIDGELFAPKRSYSTIIETVITDSRSFHSGQNALFLALKGPVHNAHYFIPDLIEKGVRAFVVSDKESITDNAEFILVGNTTNALQKLAAYNRQHFHHPVVGITGSNGKTIVKEWLNELLSTERKIVRSPKSYNSQVGVPLSVLLMNDSYNLGIIEAGISQAGEMHNLEAIIQPEIGILTNIGDAHQEFFKSIEQKLHEKLVLFRYSKKLIARIDDETVSPVVELFCKENSIEPVFWSTQKKDAPIYFCVERKETSCNIHTKIGQSTYFFTIPFNDDSAIENACHCFATIVALGINPNQVLSRFSRLQQVAMRLEIKHGINNNILINDYYNSDLNSLQIALSVLKQQAVNDHQKKVVILSDIQQTGLPDKELYTEVNRLLGEWKIDKLVGIGPNISAHRDNFSIDADFFFNSNEFESRFPYHSIQSAAILIKGARHFRFEKVSGLLQQKAHQTVLEINLNALIHNLNVFRGLLKTETKIMVMVKAFSYGSGDVEIARLLQYQNVDYLAVAVADEGVQLRNAGINLPVIVMNPERDSFQNMISYQLEPNIYDTTLLQEFVKSLDEIGIRDFPIHLKIDTGMNRLGLKSEKELNECMRIIQHSDAVKIQSVFSHLAGSDEVALDEFTHSQFEKFERAFSLISNAFSYPIDRHILNSAGIERFPEKQYEMVRLGIGLYGVSQTGLSLDSIGTLKSTISQVKNIDEHETVGYNRKGKVSKQSKIAIVPIGYADGIDRKLGNKNGSAFVNGSRVPIIGNICMDMLMLDISLIEAKAGDRVEFFGPNVSITELAQQIDTIPYEILTGISQRVKRIYVQE